MSLSCNIQNGRLCPTSGSANPCEPFQLSNGTEDCLIDDIVTESLLIGAAPILVHKLLGVHSQNALQDVTGNGVAMSNGGMPGFEAKYAFTSNGKFRSTQRGHNVIQQAFLGYDFGEFKRADGSRKYGINTFVNKEVTTLLIKQSLCDERRATKIRVERSQDGTKWLGVDIVDLPNSDELTTVTVRSSAPSRFWRIRPLAFNGAANDFWEVDALVMSEFQAPDIETIQDRILFENRDRAYAPMPIEIKGKYDPQDSVMELMPHGMQLPETINIEISFSQCVSFVGRPLVVGDILELPTETMYDPYLRPVRKFVEVTDVAWSPNGYTPGWRPTLLRIVTAPAIASQETQDVMGPIHSSFKPDGLFDVDDGLYDAEKTYQDFSEVTQSIRAEAHNDKPQDGIDLSEVRSPTADEIAKADAIGAHSGVRKYIKPNKGRYVEDGLPPNGEPFTEGDVLPQNAKDGDYHRLIYVGAAADIPPRLYRFSSIKRRWIHVETDRRFEGRFVNSAAANKIKKGTQ